MADRPAQAWRPPIVRTVAATEDGIADLAVALDGHRAHAEADGSWQRRRLDRARTEVEALAMAYLRRRVRLRRGQELDHLAAAVRDGELDAYTAAEKVLGALPLE
jgi:LAO/AO transport system kinase